MEAPKTPTNEAKRLEALKSTHLLEKGEADIFDNLTEIVKEVFHVPVVALSLIDDTKQLFKSIQGLHVVETSRDVSFCGHVVYQNEALVVSDSLDDERFFDNPFVNGAPYIRFYAGIPINYDHNNQIYPIGALCLIDFEPREMGSDELQLLKKFTRQVEHCIKSYITGYTAPNPKESDVAILVRDLINQRENYREMAELDALTELHNRRFLQSYLAKEWYSDNRHQTLTALLIDLDDFKLINDTLGHDRGDELLISMANVMRDSLRSSQDVAIRMGGDEFLVILFNTPLENTLVVAEKLLQALKRIPISESLGYLSASIGVTTTEDKTLDLPKILKSVDLSMYQAKDNGKSRIEYNPINESSFERQQAQNVSRSAISRKQKQPIMK